MSEHGSNRAVGSELLGYIERVERLEKQKKEIGEDIAAVYAEAKLDGYEPKAMKSIVKDRKAKPHDLEEAKTLKDLYESALGMKRDLPLFRHFANLGDAVTDDALIKALEPTVPPGGEIILSGILDRQRRRVIAAFVAQGLACRRTLHREGWSTILLAK